jgi:hypothetical protein
MPVVRLSTKTALAAEMVSVAHEISLIQCSISAPAVSAAMLPVRPNRKGIPCKTVTDLVKALWRLLNSLQHIWQI